MGIRSRTTIVALLVFGAAISAAALILVTVLGRSLIAEIDRSIDSRAADLAFQVDSTGEVLDPGIGIDTDTFAAIIDLDSGVLAASDCAAKPEMFALLASDPEKPMTVDLSGLSQTEGSERMRAVGLDFDTTVFDIDFSLCDFGRQFDDTGDVQARRLLAVAAASLEPVDREVGRTSRLLALLSLLLTALVGSVVWITAGRSLRPVDRMRAEVELISGTGLGRRIDDPKTGDEVSRLAATMNEMLRRLEANQDREKAFVADASHELRGPLAAIRATLDVDEVHAGTADLTRSLAVVRDQTAHLQHVVEDLLLLARFDDPGYEGRRNLVDLDEVIRQAVAGMDSRPLEVSLSIMPAVVRGDEVELRRLVVNLVANACRHATHRVEVGCDERSGLVRFWVDDDGDGVPAEDQARIFERFVRLDEARSRDKGGSGLGLAICGEIARVHGGHIAVGISPLGGARFEVSVPAAG